jgi:hypothetical protein
MAAEVQRRSAERLPVDVFFLQQPVSDPRGGSKGKPWSLQHVTTPKSQFTTVFLLVTTVLPCFARNIGWITQVMCGGCIIETQFFDVF